MKTMTKTQKILIQWFEIMPDGTPVIQSRRYNNEQKANDFGSTLYKRGVKSYTKKTTEVIKFVEESEIPDRQLSVDIESL